MTLLEIDPNWVKPGWTPLLIMLGLAAVMVLLFFSMRRQFRKINIVGPERSDAHDAPAAGSEAAGPSSGDPGDAANPTPPAVRRPRS